jgi:hypothetical protein
MGFKDGTANPSIHDAAAWRGLSGSAMKVGLGDLAAIRFSPPADGELTQDLLYRPPIERKLSDEQSSTG